MTSPHLPPAVVEHLTRRLDAIGRDGAKDAQAAMSAVYRDGGHSQTAIRDEKSALAYALVRMPATYAACVRAFDLTAAQASAFVPRTMLDLGAGPGTALLAASAVWPGLGEARLIEPNAALAAVGTAVLGAAQAANGTYEANDVARANAAARGADLIALSYVLAEQPLDKVAPLIDRVSAWANGLVVIVEPGTPAGYARVLAARGALIATGFEILAPCPHGLPCPLLAGDWCHFSVRLQRSAAHRQLKGADVPFEDERFSFVAAARPGVGVAADARLIRTVEIEKGFADLALCTTKGLATRRVMRREGAAYKAAKKAEWGDAV